MVLIGRRLCGRRTLDRASVFVVVFVLVIVAFLFGLWLGLGSGFQLCEEAVGRLKELVNAPPMVSWPAPAVNWSVLPAVSP